MANKLISELLYELDSGSFQTGISHSIKKEPMMSLKKNHSGNFHKRQLILWSWEDRLSSGDPGWCCWRIFPEPHPHSHRTQQQSWQWLHDSQLLSLGSQEGTQQAQAPHFCLACLSIEWPRSCLSPHRMPPGMALITSGEMKPKGAKQDCMLPCISPGVTIGEYWYKMPKKISLGSCCLEMHEGVVAGAGGGRAGHHGEIWAPPDELGTSRRAGHCWLLWFHWFASLRSKCYSVSFF